MQKLFEGRDVIIEVFRKYIFHFFDSDSESDSDLIKSKQNFEESVGERVKLGRQESNKLNEMITKKRKDQKQRIIRKIFSISEFI